MEDTEDSSDTQSLTDELTTEVQSPQENVVDSTVKTEQQGKQPKHAIRSTSCSSPLVAATKTTGCLCLCRAQILPPGGGP